MRPLLLAVLLLVAGCSAADAEHPAAASSTSGAAATRTEAPATTRPDEAAVDAHHAAAGLAPLADYLAEMAVVCAGD